MFQRWKYLKKWERMIRYAPSSTVIPCRLRLARCFCHSRVWHCWHTVGYGAVREFIAPRLRKGLAN
jgi:hypothetical protein